MILNIIFFIRNLLGRVSRSYFHAVAVVVVVFVVINRCAHSNLCDFHEILMSELSYVWVVLGL